MAIVEKRTSKVVNLVPRCGASDPATETSTGAREARSMSDFIYPDFHGRTPEDPASQLDALLPANMLAGPSSVAAFAAPY